MWWRTLLYDYLLENVVWVITAVVLVKERAIVRYFNVSLRVNRWEHDAI